MMSEHTLILETAVDHIGIRIAMAYTEIMHIATHHAENPKATIAILLIG